MFFVEPDIPAGGTNNLSNLSDLVYAFEKYFFVRNTKLFLAEINLKIIVITYKLQIIY